MKKNDTVSFLIGFILTLIGTGTFNHWLIVAGMALVIGPIIVDMLNDGKKND